MTIKEFFLRGLFGAPDGEQSSIFEGLEFFALVGIGCGLLYLYAVLMGVI